MHHQENLLDFIVARARGSVDVSFVGLPSNVNLGDLGGAEASSVQFRMVITRCSENKQTPMLYICLLDVSPSVT